MAQRKPAKGRKAAKPRKAEKAAPGFRSRIRPWLRRAAFALAVLVAIPLVLTPIYAIPFVHPVSTLMVKDLVTFQGYDRQWVSIDDMAPVLVHSVMMSEDGQYCRHYGIDFGALNEVIDNALDGEPVRGASTIPMQTAKNLFLWSSRSYLRKVLEAPIALYLDLVLSKRRLMEIYLNIVELGPNIYGVEAAARHHFGVSASRLSAAQASLLAVTLPNPIARDPARPGTGMRRIARIVRGRAAKAGDYVGCVK